MSNPLDDARHDGGTYGEHTQEFDDDPSDMVECGCGHWCHVDETDEKRGLCVNCYDEFMKTETKTVALLKGAPLVKNPELITVKAISPKIVEQMPFIDGEGYTSDKKPLDMTGVEIIGSLGGGHPLIVRDKSGSLQRLHCLEYLMYLHTLGMSQAEANAQYAELPQIFAA